MQQQTGDALSCNSIVSIVAVYWHSSACSWGTCLPHKLSFPLTIVDGARLHVPSRTNCQQQQLLCDAAMLHLSFNSLAS